MATADIPSIRNRAIDIIRSIFNLSFFLFIQYHLCLLYTSLRTARTIADLEGKEKIDSSHIGEALSCRAFDKKYWN